MESIQKVRRVYTLYRVSTKKQVDKDSKTDIPMQSLACHEFASQHDGWVIIKEFKEKGVSGYKVSANDRDAIQDLKEAAINGEFDILLVFMFDRIGRIEDETPFVVEWFVKHNIEVWSTQEGQQRFDNHVDKLMNYLRFWQASGESQKTSVRIKTKMQQMEADGYYTGGAIKFGYHLVDSGFLNRKNQPIKKYEIDEAEAEIVHLIDKMTVCDGYGSWRLADFLNKKGYTIHGGKFTSIKIIRILHDKFYCGLLADDASSEALQKLKIRTLDTYAEIKYILEQREHKNEDKRHIALQTKGTAMLSGNIFCAHCGGRLTVIRYRDKYIRKKDGSEYSVDQIKYSCYHKSRKLCKCDGQTTYQADRVDNVIRQIISNIFCCMDGAPEEEKLQSMFKRQMAGNRAMQKKLALERNKNSEQLTKLQLEIGKTLTGDSIYSPEDLSQAIKTLKDRVKNIEQKLIELQDEENQKKQSVDMISPAYNQFKTWAQEFNTATLEQQKMIACQLFKRIELGRDYQISVELNMTYEQFCSEWQNRVVDGFLMTRA